MHMHIHMLFGLLGPQMQSGVCVEQAGAARGRGRGLDVEEQLDRPVHREVLNAMQP